MSRKHQLLLFLAGQRELENRDGLFLLRIQLTFNVNLKQVSGFIICFGKVYRDLLLISCRQPVGIPVRISCSWKNNL